MPHYPLTRCGESRESFCPAAISEVPVLVPHVCQKKRRMFTLHRRLFRQF